MSMVVDNGIEKFLSSWKILALFIRVKGGGDLNQGTDFGHLIFYHSWLLFQKV